MLGYKIKGKLVGSKPPIWRTKPCARQKAVGALARRYMGRPYVASVGSDVRPAALGGVGGVVGGSPARPIPQNLQGKGRGRRKGICEALPPFGAASSMQAAEGMDTGRGGQGCPGKSEAGAPLNGDCLPDMQPFIADEREIIP